MKVSFFWKGIQQSVLIIEMMIQKHLNNLERMEALITSMWVKIPYHPNFPLSPPPPTHTMILGTLCKIEF